MARPTKLDVLIAGRTRKRKRCALRCAVTALSALRKANIDAFVIGSLASGTFMAHSDVDYLIEGAVAPVTRGRIEAAIAHAMAGSGIGYDVVYAEDVKPECLGDFRHAKIDASRLSELAQKAVQA